MLPLTLKVKNFTSYLDETIDFSSFPSPTAITGINGAGKSSIIDMITTVLFFRARGVDNRGSGMDELINSTADSFELEFDFLMNNIQYKVIRKKSKNGHELEFFIDGESQTENVKETQQKILNVLKVDYDTFMDTVCIGQGKSGSFMEKTPDKRKDVFSQVFGLDKYEVLEKHTKELKKSVNTDIDKVELELDQLNDKIINKEEYESIINESNLKVLEISDSIKKKEKKLEEVLAEKVKYEHMKKQRDHILNNRMNLKRKISQLETTINQDEHNRDIFKEKIKLKENLNSESISLQKDIENLQTEYTGLSNEKSSLDTTNNILIPQVKELKKKFDNLKNYNKADCDFCGHNISSEYKEQHLQKLIAEGKKYTKEVNENKNKILKIDEELKKLVVSLNTNKNKAKTLQEELTKIARAETQLVNLENRIKDNSNLLNETNLEYEENLKIDIDELEEKEFNDNILKRELDQLRNEDSSIKSKIAIAKNKLEEINLAIPKIKELNKELLDLKNLVDDYTDLINAWGKSGIQAVIIENALPEIEKEINELLEILTEGKVNIEFRTQKETKTKRKNKNPASIDTLDIIVNSDGTSRKYETYSGGEKFRVDFSCHVGLAKFLAKRAGAGIEFFIIDEGLGSQDINAREIFVQSVMQLSQFFKQIIVISHIQDVEESFANKVMVYKDPELGSKISII